VKQDQEQLMAAYSVVFEGLVHLGPGDPAITADLVNRLRPDLPAAPRVADLGCGVGASALILAETFPSAKLLAVDSHPPFIARLRAVAEARGLGTRIAAVSTDMSHPPPLEGLIGDFDLIWSESAIYALGRANACTLWRPLLRAGGWLVFSDIVWQVAPHERSPEAAFWETEYPDISTPDTVMAELAEAGFRPEEPILADRKVWGNYYEPLRDRLAELAERAGKPRALVQLMAELRQEIAVYDRGGNDVALAFFLAQRKTG
jgi:SAM-dependent methyltransferase